MGDSRFKFRAWDCVNKEMVAEDSERHCFVMDDGVPELLVYYDDEDGFIKCTHAMMQYTGLKDKNGVEIYEGDIVDDKFSERQLKVIKWDSDSACFAYYCPALDFTWQGISKTITEGEVIGNIYENPELLEGEVA